MRFLISCFACLAGLLPASTNEWYLTEELLGLAVVPIVAGDSQPYEEEMNALRHELLVEYLKLQNYSTAKAAAKSHKPDWMSHLLMPDEKSPLGRKKHLAAVEKQHGKKFAAVYKAYVRSVEKETATQGKSGLDDTALLHLITLTVSQYQTRIAEHVKDNELLEMQRMHLRFLAARIFVLNRQKKLPADAATKKVLYKVCVGASRQELADLLRNMVNGMKGGSIGNGLPDDEEARLSSPVLQKMAADWQKELQELFSEQAPDIEK